MYRDFNGFNEVVVCESIFNCLTVVSVGIPSVALNGTGTDSQIEELQNLNCRSLVLALDPDDAGDRGIKRISNRLSGNKILYKLPYKDGRDINDIGGEEFKSLYNSKIFV